MSRTRAATQLNKRRKAANKEPFSPEPGPSYATRTDRHKALELKRALRDKEPPFVVLEDGTKAYRDKIFWFHSGDVILHSGEALLCVQKSLLQECGGFFDDLFRSATANETILGKDRLTISPDFLTTRELRVLLAYLYNEYELIFQEPSGKLHLYWEAAVTLLRISAKLDMIPIRKVALEALDAIFPVKAEPVSYMPNIIGYASASDQRRFWDSFPIEVLDDLSALDAQSLLPMALYHAAQLPPEDIKKAKNSGVLSQEMTDKVVETRRALQHRYQEMLKQVMEDFDERDTEAQHCLEVKPVDFKGSHWCHHVLQKIHQEALNAHARTDILAGMSEKESAMMKHWSHGAPSTLFLLPSGFWACFHTTTTTVVITNTRRIVLTSFRSFMAPFSMATGLLEAIGLSATTVKLCVIGILLFAYIRRRASRISVAQVPGPEAESLLLGNLAEIFQSQAGVPDFKYQQLYGDIVRIKGPFGQDRLIVSDPKALQYICHTSGYSFPKWPERTEISRVLMGRGLLWADGEVHKRQRKVMLPGFGAPESRAFVPIFRRVGAELTAQWSDILASSPNQSTVLNVANWLSRSTMDTIGEAAFDYQFGALTSSNNEFMKAYFGLMNDTLGSPPKSAILMQTILPVWALQLMSKYSQARNLVHARHTATLANAVAKELVESKAEALLQGKGNKDILSLLVKANASERSETRLTDEELFAQMRTILLAGHETSATSLCWVLLELAKNPDIQNKLRAEIREMERTIHARGDKDFTANDLDNMPYLSAVIKESMRFHPALYQNYRQAAHDDVLPLSKPIKTLDGNSISKLPIPKGLKIVLSIAAYNRNTDVFGEDANVFNPERWLRDSGEKRGPTLGVYGNLMTFSGGVRTCIGWRFAVYQMHSLVVEIINNFELSPTPELDRLRREACLVMLPTLEGEQLKGENLPLRVSLAARD